MLWITRFVIGALLWYLYYIDMRDMKIISVFQSGTGLALNLPRSVLRALGIERGDSLLWTLAEGNIICFRKLREEEKARFDLPEISL